VSHQRTATAYHNHVMAPGRLTLPFTDEPIGDVLSGQAVRHLAAMLREAARTRQPQIASLACESDVWVVDVRPLRGSRVACETTWILAARGRWQAAQDAVQEALEARQRAAEAESEALLAAASHAAARSRLPAKRRTHSGLRPYRAAAARPRPTERRRVVTLRLSPAEHERLRSEALACQMSLQKYLHTLVLKAGPAATSPAKIG